MYGMLTSRRLASKYWTCVPAATGPGRKGGSTKMSGPLQKVGVVGPRLHRSPHWTSSGANVAVSHCGGVCRWKVINIGRSLIVQDQAWTFSRTESGQSHECGQRAHNTINVQKLSCNANANSYVAANVSSHTDSNCLDTYQNSVWVKASLAFCDCYNT